MLLAQEVTKKRVRLILSWPLPHSPLNLMCKLILYALAIILLTSLAVFAVASEVISSRLYG